MHGWYDTLLNPHQFKSGILTVSIITQVNNDSPWLIKTPFFVQKWVKSKASIRLLISRNKILEFIVITKYSIQGHSSFVPFPEVLNAQPIRDWHRRLCTWSNTNTIERIDYKDSSGRPPSIRRDRIEDNSRNEEPCRFKRSQSSEMFECAAAVLLSQYRAP